MYSLLPEHVLQGEPEDADGLHHSQHRVVPTYPCYSTVYSPCYLSMYSRVNQKMQMVSTMASIRLYLPTPTIILYTPPATRVNQKMQMASTMASIRLYLPTPAIPLYCVHSLLLEHVLPAT